jgi:AcrR family transcriptional regulator
MVTAEARRTQAERRSRSEEALLDAAAELIAERGVERASLASIGERAGVSRGLPTHHFGAKTTLVARLAERTQEQIAEFMLERRGPRTDITGLDVVYNTVDAYLELFQHPSPDIRALLVMWGSTFSSSSSVEGMADAERRSYEGLAEVIAAGQNDGSIRADVDPTAVAVLLLGMKRGTAALLLTDSDLTDMRRVRATCRNWITAALGAGAALTQGGDQ